jgi:hypothetical protein
MALVNAPTIREPLETEIHESPNRVIGWPPGSPMTQDPSAFWLLAIQYP